MGSPGSIEHARKERILRAAIKARDSIVQAKLHCEALMDELRGQRISGEQFPLSQIPGRILKEGVVSCRQAHIAGVYALWHSSSCDQVMYNPCMAWVILNGSKGLVHACRPCRFESLSALREQFGSGPRTCADHRCNVAMLTGILLDVVCLFRCEW